jgi:hypothetical protein
MSDAAFREGLIGASCSLGAEDVRIRQGEWTALRGRARSVRKIEGGISMVLDGAEPIVAVADLVARESACCPFYTFELHVDGPTRQLDITAGSGGEPAVHALLGVDRQSISEQAERR